MVFFYLGQSPGLLWPHLPEGAQDALVKMAGLSLDHFTLSINNWNLFPILIQLGLKRLGLPWDRAAVDSLWLELELMYKGEGWYADGYHRQFDYYVAWEMHAFGLVAANWLADERPDLWERACHRAVRFAQSYELYFDDIGRHIPYGRSLSYRYAAATFWGVAAWLGVPGLSQANLIQKTHANLTAVALNSEGMSVTDLGFTYHQQLLPEPYIATGSALGSNAFQVLAIPADSSAWLGDPNPQLFSKEAYRIEAVPNLILSRTHGGRQAVLYNQGSMHPFDFGNHPAKYGKFAYSSHFGFNLASPAFPSLDNMISFSWDGVFWSHRFHFQPLPPQGGWIVSRHRPFRESSEVDVVTALIVKDCWHVRVHRVLSSGEDLFVREAGFPLDTAARGEAETSGQYGNVLAWIRGSNGVSGVYGLRGSWEAESSGIFPNLNTYSRYSMVPLLKCRISAKEDILAVAIYQSPDPDETTASILSGPTLEKSGDRAWSIRWPDGSISEGVNLTGLPAFALPGTAGKRWSRPERRLSH